MGKMVKNRLAVILGVLVILFFATNVKSCLNLSKLSGNLNNERSTRFDLEKTIEDLKKGKANLTQELDNAARSLEEEKSAHQATQKAMLEEKMMNESLRDELKKLNKRKLELEEELKKALLSGNTEYKK